MPAKQLYLAGYSRQTIETLEAAVNSLGVTLVDVRLRPFSRRPEFNATSLVERFGDRYVGLPEWGNLNHAQEKPWENVKIADFDAGLAKFEALDGPVMLLCVCYDAYKCHRHELANRLYSLGYTYRMLKLEEYAPNDDAPTLF